jgi:hypothetical protein
MVRQWACWSLILGLGSSGLCYQELTGKISHISFIIFHLPFNEWGVGIFHHSSIVLVDFKAQPGTKWQMVDST